MRAQIQTADPLLLVNAAHSIPDASCPELIAVDPRWPEVLLARRAAALLNACIRSVGGEEHIVPVSGWRSRKEQQAIWDQTLAREGAVFTRQYVACPGHSEHETGLAIDLGLAAPEIDFIRPYFPYDGVCGAFRRRAADFGFILRYPAGKEGITDSAHEPWHFRYVGVPHAQLMVRLGLTLEEYLLLLRQNHTRRPLTTRAGTRIFQIQYCRDTDRSDGEDTRALPCQISADNCGGFVVTTWR